MDILPQLLVNALIAGSIYALSAAGLSLVYGLLRVMNFAHGHFLMVGAYAFYFFHVEYERGIVVSALGAALLMGGVSILVMQIFLRPFLQQSFLLPLVTTLALSNILESVVSMVFGVNVKSLSAGEAGKSFEIGSVYITPIQILIILSAVLLLSAIAFVIHSTSLGRKVRAMSENPYAAESLGINAVRLRAGVFLAAALLAGYAGILVGYETNIQPTMGSAYTMKAFAAMILGGLGNIWGTVVGSFLLGLIENLAIGLDFGPYSLPAGYKDAFAFVIILFVLLLKPEGLFGTARRKA